MSTDVAMGRAFDLAVQDLDAVISRNFAAHRTLVVERESSKHWTATIEGTVLYRSPDRDAVVRFALTFAERTAGVEVRYDEDWADGHSVRVPSNVVPILGRVEA